MFQTWPGWADKNFRGDNFFLTDPALTLERAKKAIRQSEAVHEQQKMLKGNSKPTVESNLDVLVVVVVLLILQDGCIYQKVGLHTGPQFKKMQIWYKLQQRSPVPLISSGEIVASTVKLLGRHCCILSRVSPPM